MSADRNKYAKESLDKVQHICEKYGLAYLGQLLKLVEASINLELEKKRAVGDSDLQDLWAAEEYFEDLADEETATTSDEDKALARENRRRGHLGLGEVHFLHAVSKIKQLEKLMASSEDNFGNEHEIKIQINKHRQMSEEQLSQTCYDMIFNETSTG